MGYAEQVMNWKEFGRNRACPNCVTVVELSWRDLKKKNTNILGQGS